MTNCKLTQSGWKVSIHSFAFVNRLLAGQFAGSRNIGRILSTPVDFEHSI
jgi:hypothetical protein